jgi:hypothetical protein
MSSLDFGANVEKPWGYFYPPCHTPKQEKGFQKESEQNATFCIKYCAKSIL